MMRWLAFHTSSNPNEMDLICDHLLPRKVQPAESLNSYGLNPVYCNPTTCRRGDPVASLTARFPPLTQHSTEHTLRTRQRTHFPSSSTTRLDCSSLASGFVSDGSLRSIDARLVWYPSNPHLCKQSPANLPGVLEFLDGRHHDIHGVSP